MNEPHDEGLPPLRDHIAGAWSEPAVALADHVEDPNTGAEAQRQRATDDGGIEAALAAADAAAPGWSGRPAQERAELLEALADDLEPRVPESARLESATSGAVIAATSMLGFITHGAFRLAAGVLRDGVTRRTLDGDGGEVEVLGIGRGPAVLLCPWNAPAPMAAHKMASALAAGCPVIIKPPERAPHGSAVLAEAAEAVGLEPGVVQLVHGGPDVAQRLIGDDRTRAVSFTGGLVGGRAVAHTCAEGLKPVQLELGGHSPVVVMPDADVEAAAAGVAALLTTLNGQWCRALGRLLVPTDRHDELVDAVGTVLTGLPIGSSLDPGSAMGPIVHSAHLAHLRDRIAELVARGGEAHAWSTVPDDAGNWLAPTLVTGVDPAETTTEIFGPVGTVHPYADLDEALALANGTPYGLEAYVFGGDEEAALAFGRQVRAGGVKVNGASPISLHLMAPRPAWGVSGLHDEGTVETIEFFMGQRVVGVEGPPPGAPDAEEQP